MKALAMVLVVCCLSVISCAALSPDTITLSSSEKQTVLNLAEARQHLVVEQNKAQAAFQAEMNRFSERATSLNVQAQELCFEFKKAHKIPPGANYQLDEFNGTLAKIGK